MIKGNKRYLIISYMVFFESSTGAEERPGCYLENYIKWKAPEAVLVLKFISMIPLFSPWGTLD